MSARASCEAAMPEGWPKVALPVGCALSAATTGLLDAGVGTVGAGYTSRVGATMLHLELARDEGAARRVRLALDDVEGLDPVIVDDAKLVATELVTNSVKFGGTGPVEFSVKRGRRGVVRLEVVDPGRGFRPRLRPRQPDDIGGWGLWLVERLSHRWGVAKGSAQVWCEFKTSSAGAAG